jgi:hypothetical protein
MRKLASAVSAVALVVGSMSAPAFATATQTPTANPLSGDNAATMASTCTAAALALDDDGVGTGNIWTGTVVLGSVDLVAGPTEVLPLARTNWTNIVGTGTLVPSAPYISGNPYRIGGSVNMFGDQRASAGYYPSSTYDYVANFTSTFAHSYSCNINKALYHASYVIPGHPVQGYYIVHSDGHGNEEGAQQSCDAFSAKQPTSLTDTTVPWWGYVDPDPTKADQGQCDFIKTADATPDVTVPESWDTPVLVTNVAQTAINQDQTDSLAGHEANGGRVDVTGDFFIGQVVICISPKKLPGVWTKQNGYTGGNCTTAWFNTAPWGGGSQTSNGTYISVPAT